MNNFG
jgi:X-linked retinitis pigmentosa GTPase regulator